MSENKKLSAKGICDAFQEQCNGAIREEIREAVPGFGMKNSSKSYHKMLKKKKELDTVKKIGKEVGANAVRFVLKDYDEYNCKIGDILNNNSYVWKNGVQTNEMLNGLCFILLANLNMVYCYDALLFVSAENHITGDDKDEIIVSNPTILHIIRSESS